MKLRNKKTGEIIECRVYFTTEDKIKISYMADSNTNSHCAVNISYDSIAELSENFEIAKETEPLIKDEKIRKAVRAWLAIQEQPIVEAAITCSKDSDGFLNYHIYGYIEEARISNGKAVKNKNLTAIVFEFRNLEKIKFDVNRDYTIAELCGEEDEQNDEDWEEFRNLVNNGSHIMSGE